MIGFNNLKSLIFAAKNSKSIREVEYSRQKNVSGMTKLLEPEIIKESKPQPVKEPEQLKITLNPDNNTIYKNH